MRRPNSIDQAIIQSEDSPEDEAENMVLQVRTNGAPPFVLQGKLNNVTFCTRIDAGSPVTNFTHSDLKKTLKTDTLFARLLPKGED